MKILFLIIIMGVLLCGCFEDRGYTSPAQIEQAFQDAQLPIPVGVDLEGIPYSPFDREGRCINLSVVFVSHNPGWDLVAANIIAPEDGRLVAHMFSLKDGVVFDSSKGRFFNQSKYWRFYQVSNVSIFPS